MSSTRQHTLKVVAPYFDDLASGDKTFEVRQNDRGYQRGDVLTLWEYNPTPGGCKKFPCTTCKPRAVTRVVTYVYAGDPRFGRDGGIESGFVVLGLGVPPSVDVSVASALPPREVANAIREYLTEDSP